MSKSMLPPLHGAEEILRERHEQLTKHGRTVIADAKHNSGKQLIFAARRLLSVDDGFYPRPPEGWDTESWRKMCSKDIRERYAISGAFIAAEIDRMDFDSGIVHMYPVNPLPFNMQVRYEYQLQEMAAIIREYSDQRDKLQRELDELKHKLSGPPCKNQ